MKRYIYDIVLCLLVVALTACNDEMTSNRLIVEGEKVELDMSLVLGEMPSASSRALGEYSLYTEGNHPSLWVVAFDKNGYLVEWAKATDQQFKADATLYETAFKVTLHGTSEPRILHFLLNYTDELTLEYGHESNVIGSMMVGNGKDVYWQRIVSNEGISNDTSFERIPLLRNFAKITVENSYADNFQMSGFYVVNPPKYGMVAPYANGAFVDYLKEGTETTKTYFELLEEGYTGTTPVTKEYDTEYAESKWVDTDKAFYTYENPFHKDAEETVSILVKGKYRTDTLTSYDGITETYYHVDMVYTPEDTGLPVYFNVLRNFNYQYNIKFINGHGKESPQEAIASPAGNNLIGSVIISDMPNISDGTAALYVLYTDTVTVTGDPIRLKYKFTDNMNMADTDPDYHKNGKVTTSLKGDNVFQNYKFLSNTKDGDGNYTLLDAADITNDNLYVDANGWGVIVLYPNAPGDYTQTQTLTIANTDTRLSRDVVFQMRPRMTYLVDCTEKVLKQEGEDVTVRILLPDGLNENLFPLDFSIEADDTASDNLLQYLSPNSTEEISVKTGNSIVKNEGVDFTSEPSFQYVKNLTYEEYLELGTETVNGVVYRVFPCHFITNVDASASTVYVYNKYFHLAWDDFTNIDASNIGDVSLTETAYYGLGKAVTVKFKALATGEYRVTSYNLNEQSVEVSATAGQEYMVTLYTDTWRSASQVTVEYEGEEATVVASTERDVLQMWARSATYNGSALSDTSLKMYVTEEAAMSQEDTSIATVTASQLTSGYTDVEVADLQATSPLYFSYGEGDYVYVASATAEALAEHTADLVFTQYELPTEMSVSFGDGTQYYGVGKTFTLTFTTNKAGTYTISNVEGSVSNDILSYSDPSTGMTLNDDGTFTVTAAGTYTLTCTTQTWATKAAVYISMGSATASAIGADRNVLLVPKTTVTGTNSKNRTLSVTYEGNTAGAGSITTEREGNSGNRTYYIQGEIILAGIPSADTDLTLSYINYFVTYSATITARNLIAGRSAIALEW